MSQISAAEVKKLRDRTNAPFKDCKAALAKADGDIEKAIEELRKIGSASQDKKEGRETAEGRVGIFIDEEKQVGGIIEMLCESAPSAKNDHFVSLCSDLAKHVAVEDPASSADMLKQKLVTDESKTVEERIADTFNLIRENMKLGRVQRLTGLLGSYIHHDNTIGVLLQVEGAKVDDPGMLRDVCMHVAALRPVAATVDAVDPEIIEKEKRIAVEQAKATGKPDNIVEKIAEGKLKAWYKENVLTEQPFVKDDKKTVAEFLKGAGLKVVTFVCYKVGEGQSVTASEE